MLILNDSNLRKQIIKIAWPAMMEMIMYMVIGVVDVAIVGRLGPAPLAAVGLGTEVFFAVVLLFEALAMGSCILAAQAKGSGRTQEIIQITGHTLVMGVIIGTVIGLLGCIYADEFIGLFAVEDAVYHGVVSYLAITFKAAPAAILLYMLHSIFRGLGRTEIPMIIALVINIVNSMGDYVLVYGKWGFPAMGVAGAALATSVAHIAGLIIVLYFLFSGKGGIEFNWEQALTLEKNIFRNIFRLGVPSFGEQVFWAASNFISIFLIVYTGTLAYASHQLALTVESISFMPGFGIAIAATSLVGQYLGAGDTSGIKKSSRGTLELAVLFMGFFAVLFFFFPYYIAALFTNDTKIINFSGQLIRIAAFEQLTIAIGMVIGGILKGAGDTRTPMLISIVFTWLFRLPMMYIFVKVLFLPVTYVWWLFIADWAMRTTVFTILIRRKNWLIKALNTYP